jgi:hypothetical protein
MRRRRISAATVSSTQRDICCRTFAPALPSNPAASLESEDLSLRVDKLQQQTTDFLGLLLLNPISGTIDEMRAAPLSTSRGLHHLKSTGKLVHAPIALARNETRRHIDGAVGRANANLLDSKIRSRSIRDVSPSRAAV